MRSCGILFPVFSLPGRDDLGTFGSEAFEFVDFLKQAGQRYWQILPLSPTIYADSPYQSTSAFAGNPYFIDYRELIRLGVLLETEVPQPSEKKDRVDYGKLYLEKKRSLRRAYEREFPKVADEIAEFRIKNAYWLEDYALFSAVKDELFDTSLKKWPASLKKRDPDALQKAKIRLDNDIGFYVYLQFVFDRQWQKLKKYANVAGIKIIGDLPIYIAFDSADFWVHRELFLTDADQNPAFLAGCPPDGYAPKGQLWGNPLYDWDAMKREGYRWFRARIEQALSFYDVLRLDHFRAFEAFYSIKASEKDAANGKWVTGPGKDFFDAVPVLTPENVIAEDLGYLTPEVRKLLKDTRYPGMKVLQFAFDPMADSEYLPHNHEKNSVCYTGTHDNDTVRGYYAAASEAEREFAAEYLNLAKGKEAEGFIRAALSSVSNTAIIPLADYLNLSSNARINTPSTVEGNWNFRLKHGVLNYALAEKIRWLAKLYRR